MFANQSIEKLEAYDVVGNVATLNARSPVPDKNAARGDLAVLYGKSFFIALVETKAAAITTSFFKSVKILS